jgi:hypothetical protein
MCFKMRIAVLERKTKKISSKACRKIFDHVETTGRKGTSKEVVPSAVNKSPDFS